MTILERIRRLYAAPTTRFFHDEPNNLTALQQDGRKAKARIDKSTLRSRDRELGCLLEGMYPDEQSQDC